MNAWERLAAFVAVAVAIALNVSASVELFTPSSTFGYRLVYTQGNRVAEVDPGTAAARAGIAVGDRLDFARSSLHDRIVGMEYQPPLSGERISFAVAHDGRSRDVTLQAAPLTEAEAHRAIFSPIGSFLRLAGFAYIAIALVILMRLPNRMTWGLFLYLVSATDVTFYRFPEWLFPIAQFASDVLGVAGPVGLVIFAARFPENRPTGWRAAMDRLAIPVGALFAIPNLAWDATSLLAGESPSAWMALGSIVGALTLISIAGVTLVAAYFSVARWERQRFGWVIAGVLFTLVNYASQWGRYWSTTYSLVTSDALVWTAVVLYAFAPGAIAYAVVRQRVFGFSFVVSRTLVYTILTGSLFALFALIEWLAGRVIERSGVTIALVAVTAIVVAFSLEAAHARIEGFVESQLFRRRHLAERHLAVVAAGLPRAENAATVEDALTREPVQAYKLAGAALFKRDDSGNYKHDGETLEATVSLRLQGTRRAVRLHELERGEAAETPSAGLVLAIPIFVRARLEAVAAYGAHVNGEDIDPDEAASLEGLCSAAGAAYDRLEAQRMRREIERLRRLVERQAHELAALRERNSLRGDRSGADDPKGSAPA